ncbi:TRAP transporter small permease subunit [Opitutia bacterium KCR 482]|nr:TRAP transporter small permease subunit [Opitutae bacterium KCR 482]
MIIRRTRFDDFDDWLETVDWKKVKENTGAPMMKLIRLYIRSVGKFSEFVGEGAMYLLLAMMGILLYSIITNAMHHPVIWVMEMSQFTMAAYYILGGASSLKHGIHVRMDFLYERWKPRTKAIVDVFTVFFLLFYLYIMVKGGWDSSAFALEFDQRNHSVWKPPMAPIKIVMTAGMALMFLQAVAELLKDFCRAIGRKY